MNDFCLTWPEELKELNRKHYRAVCKMRNLEAYIEQVSPYEFDAVMDELEQVRDQVQAFALEFEKAYRRWANADIARITTRSRETEKK